MRDGHITMKATYTYDYLLHIIEQAQAKGISELTILEPTFQFKECASLYREVCETYPYQKAWLHEHCRVSIREYQHFIIEMRKQVFPIKISFGLEVCYFTQHEEFIQQMKNAFPYDVVVGCIQFIDNVAFAWPKHSQEMLWKKYNADFLYRRYYEMMNALLTSHLFDGVAGFDSIKTLQVPCKINLHHTYQKLAHLLAKEKMFVENDTSLGYRYHHPDQGLAKEFITLCGSLSVPIVLVSNASVPEEIAKNFS